MCQKCVDAVQEYYPDCPQQMMGDFLFAATCFPFGTPEKVREQLANMRARGQDTWRKALAYTDEQVTQAMANYIELEPYLEDETHTTSPPGS